MPLIFEAHGGGWAAGTAAAIAHITRSQKAKGLWSVEGISERLAERIVTTLQRANARAIHKRVTSADPPDAIPADITPVGDYADDGGEGPCSHCDRETCLHAEVG